MKHFKVGMFVKTVEGHGEGYYKEGEVGVIISVSNSGSLGVRFKEHNKRRHNLNGACENGHGRWLDERCLVRVASTNTKLGVEDFHINSRTGRKDLDFHFWEE